MRARAGTGERGGDRRLRRLAVTGVLVAAAVAGTLAHAAAGRARWRAGHDARAAAARRVGLGDLALSSTSRWLRNPALSEPGAPFADAPAILDADPAGGLLGPPLDAWRRDGAAAPSVRRRGPEGGTR